MKILLMALLLAVVLEGMVYAAFPEAMQNMMRRIVALPPGALRMAGLTAAIIGIGLLWVVRQWAG